MKCRKMPSRTCGAGWRNEVFDLAKVKKKEIVYKTLIGETRIGCYLDKGNRDLPKLIRSGYGDPRKCFQEAKNMGFRYAGL